MAAKESRNDKKGLGRGWLAVREIRGGAQEESCVNDSDAAALLNSNPLLILETTSNSDHIFMSYNIIQ